MSRGFSGGSSSRQSLATRDPSGAQDFEPLRQDGIVGHGPTYGTMQSGGNMIGIDRPQRGHNILAHGSAVGPLDFDLPGVEMTWGGVARQGQISFSDRPANFSK
jgi:hypothetical protein